jgi:hypothetical protein
MRYPEEHFNLTGGRNTLSQKVLVTEGNPRWFVDGLHVAQDVDDLRVRIVLSGK